jgi:hypothetical protein
MTRRLRVHSLVALFAGVACGGATEGGAPGTGKRAGAECTPLEELALSPRPDAEAERLAFLAAGTLTAPTDVYTRIHGDLASIRVQVPELATIVARQRWKTNELAMGVDEVGFAAMNAGTYTAWDCANARYGSSGWEGTASSFTSPPTHSVRVLFGERRLNIPLLVDAYSSLPHRITWIGPTTSVGDGNDVCAAQSGDAYSYVFKKGEGDCPAGCTEVTYWGFSTSPGGAVTTLGKSGPAGPRPAWVLALPTCKNL